MYVIMCLNSFFIRETLYTQVHPAYKYALVTSQWKVPHPPGIRLDQACLLNEANSLLCGAISYIKTSLFSQSQGQYSLQKSQMYLIMTKLKYFKDFCRELNFYKY